MAPTGPCRNANGQAKVRFVTRAEAKARVRELRELPDFEGEPKPYRCPQCGYFHLGHYPDVPFREGLRRRHRNT